MDFLAERILQAHLRGESLDVLHLSRMGASRLQGGRADAPAPSWDVVANFVVLPIEHCVNPNADLQSPAEILDWFSGKVLDRPADVQWEIDTARWVIGAIRAGHPEPPDLPCPPLSGDCRVAAERQSLAVLVRLSLEWRWLVTFDWRVDTEWHAAMRACEQAFPPGTRCHRAARAAGATTKAYDYFTKDPSDPFRISQLPDDEIDAAITDLVTGDGGSLTSRLEQIGPMLTDTSQDFAAWFELTRSILHISGNSHDAIRWEAWRARHATTPIGRTETERELLFLRGMANYLPEPQNERRASSPWRHLRRLQLLELAALRGRRIHKWRQCRADRGRLLLDHGLTKRSAKFVGAAWGDMALGGAAAKAIKGLGLTGLHLLERDAWLSDWVSSYIGLPLYYADQVRALVEAIGDAVPRENLDGLVGWTLRAQRVAETEPDKTTVPVHRHFWLSHWHPIVPYLSPTERSEVASGLHPLLIDLVDNGIGDAAYPNVIDEHRCLLEFLVPELSDSAFSHTVGALRDRLRQAGSNERKLQRLAFDLATRWYQDSPARRQEIMSELETVLSESLAEWVTYFEAGGPPDVEQDPTFKRELLNALDEYLEKIDRVPNTPMAHLYFAGEYPRPEAFGRVAWDRVERKCIKKMIGLLRDGDVPDTPKPLLLTALSNMALAVVPGRTAGFVNEVWPFVSERINEDNAAGMTPDPNRPPGHHDDEIAYAFGHLVQSMAAVDPEHGRQYWRWAAEGLLRMHKYASPTVVLLWFRLIPTEVQGVSEGEKLLVGAQLAPLLASLESSVLAMTLRHLALAVSGDEFQRLPGLRTWPERMHAMALVALTKIITDASRSPDADVRASAARLLVAVKVEPLPPDLEPRLSNVERELRTDPRRRVRNEFERGD